MPQRSAHFRSNTRLAGLCAISLLLLGQPRAFAQVAPATLPADQVAASDARRRLRLELEQLPISEALRLHELVSQTDSAAKFESMLRDQSRLSPPRAVGDAFTQVRADIAGPAVADFVRAIAGTLSPDQLAKPQLDLAAKQIAMRTFSATGIAVTRQGVMEVADVWLPSKIPTWATQPIDVSAIAAPAASKLLTARAAERSAREKLSSEVAKLPLERDDSVEKLCKRQAIFSQASDLAVRGAQIVGCDYRADDTVEIRLRLHGQSLWTELRAAEDFARSQRSAPAER